MEDFYSTDDGEPKSMTIYADFEHKEFAGTYIPYD